MAIRNVLLYLQQQVLPRVPDLVEFLGNGDGTLQAAKVLLGSPGLPEFSFLDINHDGRPDIVAPDQNIYSPAITTYLGQMDDGFSGLVQRDEDIRISVEIEIACDRSLHDPDRVICGQAAIGLWPRIH